MGQNKPLGKSGDYVNTVKEAGALGEIYAGLLHNCGKGARNAVHTEAAEELFYNI